MKDQMAEWKMRLEMVEAQLAIAQLRAQYCHFADDGRWADLAQLFAPDAEFRAMRVAKGREDILAYLEEFPAGMDAWWHMSHNETTIVHGATAYGSAYFDAPCVIDGVPHVCAGRYDDQFVRSGENWFFSKRALTFFYFAPLADGWRRGAVPSGLAAHSPSFLDREDSHA